MRIGPMDILAAGTRVSIGNKLGEVVSHEVVPAHPSGMIVVHTFRITSRVKTVRRASFPLPGKTAIVTCNELYRANYAFVNVIE